MLNGESDTHEPSADTDAPESTPSRWRGIIADTGGYAGCVALLGIGLGLIDIWQWDAYSPPWTGATVWLVAIGLLIVWLVRSKTPMKTWGVLGSMLVGVLFIGCGARILFPDTLFPERFVALTACLSSETREDRTGEEVPVYSPTKHGVHTPNCRELRREEQSLASFNEVVSGHGYWFWQTAVAAEYSPDLCISGYVPQRSMSDKIETWMTIGPVCAAEHVLKSIVIVLPALVVIDLIVRLVLRKSLFRATCLP